jgi:hypothetical protein
MRETINFYCGCFVSFWAEDGEVKSALACCEKHEQAHQTLANIRKRYDITFTLKDNVKQVAICSHCGITILREYWKGTINGWCEWAHNEPTKPNYKSTGCIERGKSLHSSSVPHATAKEGSVRYVEQ